MCNQYVTNVWAKRTPWKVNIGSWHCFLYDQKPPFFFLKHIILPFGILYAGVCPSCLRIWDRNLLLPPQLCWWLITWLNHKKHTLNELWILSEACKNRNNDMIGLMPHSKFQIMLRRWFLSHPLLLLKKTHHALLHLSSQQALKVGGLSKFYL